MSPVTRSCATDSFPWIALSKPLIYLGLGAGNYCNNGPKQCPCPYQSVSLLIVVYGCARAKRWAYLKRRLTTTKMTDLPELSGRHQWSQARYLPKLVKGWGEVEEGTAARWIQSCSVGRPGILWCNSRLIFETPANRKSIVGAKRLFDVRCGINHHLLLVEVDVTVRSDVWRRLEVVGGGIQLEKLLIRSMHGLDCRLPTGLDATMLYKVVSLRRRDKRSAAWLVKPLLYSTWKLNPWSLESQSCWALVL